MEAAGVSCEGLTYLALAKGCEEGGLSQLSSTFYDLAEKNGVDLTSYDTNRSLNGGPKKWKRKLHSV